jgi:hypothetical protein
VAEQSLLRRVALHDLLEHALKIPSSLRDFCTPPRSMLCVVVLRSSRVRPLGKIQVGNAWRQESPCE